MVRCRLMEKNRYPNRLAAIFPPRVEETIPQQPGSPRVSGEMVEPVVDASFEDKNVKDSADAYPVEFPDMRADEAKPAVKPVKGFDPSKVYMRGQREGK